MTKTEIYAAAINKYGQTAQIDQAQEECAELIVALNKYKRSLKQQTHTPIDVAIDHIREEIIDVTIMLEQLATVFCKDNELEELKEYKLMRLAERIGHNDKDTSQK